MEKYTRHGVEKEEMTAILLPPPNKGSQKKYNFYFNQDQYFADAI